MLSVPDASGLSITLRLALPRRGRGGTGGLAGKLLLGVGLTVDAMGGVFMGGAMALGVAAEVRFELRERGAFFSTVADLTLWNMWYACEVGYSYSIVITMCLFH